MDDTTTQTAEKTKRGGKWAINILYGFVFSSLVLGAGIFGGGIYDKVAGETLILQGTEIYLNSAEKVAQGRGGEIVEVVIKNNNKENETYKWVLKIGETIIKKGELSLEGEKEGIVAIDQADLSRKYSSNNGDNTFVEFDLEGYSSYLRWPVGGL